MKFHAYAFGCLMFVCFSAQAGEGEIWERKRPEEWSAKDCKSILQTSPWVRRDASMFPAPPRAILDQGGGKGRRAAGEEGSEAAGTADDRSTGQVNILYFRWHSSLLVRQAIVRDLLLRGNINEAQTRQFLNNPAMQKSLVLSISADSPQPLLRLVRGKEESIRAQSYLEKKSKQRIAVERVVPMDLSKGATDLLLVFPRETYGKPTLQLEDKEVEIVFVVGDKKARQKFRLDKMVIDGKLDL